MKASQRRVELDSVDGGYKGPRAKVEGVETWYGLGCSVLLFSISTTPSCSTSARESIVQSKPANAVLQLAEGAAAGHREPKKGCQACGRTGLAHRVTGFASVFQGRERAAKKRGLPWSLAPPLPPVLCQSYPTFFLNQPSVPVSS